MSRPRKIQRPRHKRYPAGDGASEEVRELAELVVADLRAAERTKRELMRRHAASGPSVQRALSWIRECGLDVRPQRDKPGCPWRIYGQKKQLPARALGRDGLLERLRGLLGDDVDPLEKIETLIGGGCRAPAQSK